MLPCTNMLCCWFLINDRWGGLPAQLADGLLPLVGLIVFISFRSGLLELEASLPDFVVHPRIKAPKPKTVTKSGFVKRRYRQERELQEIHEVREHYRKGVANM